MTLSTQQVLSQAITSVMTVSVFAQAMGMMAATSAIPKGIPPTDAGIRSLKASFGASLVTTAIDNVGKEDIIALAREVERLYISQMKRQYGEHATKMGLQSAPPGDLRTANEIASTIAGQKITSESPPEKAEKAVEAGKKRGRQKAQPVKDTKTGIVYSSKAKAGMAVAAEYGEDPKNHFAWYAVIKKDPKRFVRA